MTKPIDRVKGFIADRKYMRLCQWGVEYPRSPHSRYRCGKRVIGDEDGLQSGDERCTVEDWAVCPLNKEVK